MDGRFSAVSVEYISNSLWFNWKTFRETTWAYYGEAAAVGQRKEDVEIFKGW